MVDTVLNTSAILQSCRDSLKADLRTKNMVLKVMGLINTNPSVAKHGWVGLFAEQATYEPHTIGSGSRNWQYNMTMRVVVQAVDLDSSENAYVRLETYAKAVLDVILSDVTVAGVVDHLLSISVEYLSSDTDKPSLHFEGALLTLIFQGRSN